MKRFVARCCIAVTLISVILFCGCAGAYPQQNAETSEYTRYNVFKVTIQNATDAYFTSWADNSIGNKEVEVKSGSKLEIPAIKYDSMDNVARNDATYYFDGWFYKDKNGIEQKLDLNTEFSLENLNVDSYDIKVYAKVTKQVYGPY